MTLQEQLTEIDKEIEALYFSGSNDEKLNSKKRAIQKLIREN